MNGGTENDALMHFLLADSIRQALLRKYGVLLFGDALYEVLGSLLLTDSEKLSLTAHFRYRSFNWISGGEIML